ncbi:LysR family transcriptional regulator [Pelosinus sp. sgz500959]|uniref:LysR family transcriptional regulator n=1 Tax=Pelosinus sp. sgz500959 TaxID=3242472 RepID=UPI003671CB07
MEWQQLEYFKIVAQTQHVTHAADLLSISQPALSRSIAKLEEELGFLLFDRRGKNIILNPYGQLFLEHVERAMQEIVDGKQMILDLLHPDWGSVSLSFLHSLGSNLVPGLLSKFRAANPNIQFKLFQNATNFLLEQLNAGEIDLCLCAPVTTNENIEWEPLFAEELFVIVPTGHRLAKRASITLDEIKDEPVVTFKKDYGLRILADQLFKEEGLDPFITFEGEEIMTVAGLVEAKLGIALIPHVFGLDKTNISFLPISTPTCQRIIGLASTKGKYLSPAAQKFKNFVLNEFR